MSNGPRPDPATPAESLRLDRWLWYARFFKSRSAASRLCASGKVRVNRQIIRKAHHAARPGDVLTFPQGRNIRVVRIAQLGSRRGPASEAQTLYEDLAPPQSKAASADTGADRGKVAPRESGAGRPTKAERRAIDRLKQDD